MFTTMLESNRVRTRRHRYAIASVIVHVALVGAAVVASASAATDADADQGDPPILTYVEVPPPADAPRTPPDASATGPAVPGAEAIVAPRIEVIVPPIQLAVPLPDAGSTLFDPTAPGQPSPAIGPGAVGSGAGSGVTDGREAFSGSRTQSANGVLGALDVDRVAALRSAAAPVYPGVLRRAGVEGQVVVRFVVDTLGRVEAESVEVREASHAPFADAVREVMPRLRFRPATAGGRRVRQLVEMPFEFRMDGGTR